MRRYLFALTALMVPCLSAGADAPAIGRLFSTPAERAGLDRLRQLGEQTLPPDDQPVTVIAPPEPAREQYTLDGFVRRSSGKSTIWINRVPRSEHEISQGILVRQQLSKPPAVSILLPSGQRLNLKPGQTFDNASGRVSEVYEAVPDAPEPEVPR